MSTTIADTRRAVGWTVRELAENMVVAPSTVTRMEQSERDDRIQLGTLTRALSVMGRSPRVEIVNNRLAERVTMELHRALANKLKNDPKAALEVAPKNLSRLRSLVPSLRMSGSRRSSGLTTRDARGTRRRDPPRDKGD